MNEPAAGDVVGGKMKTKTEELFDVVIYEKATRRIDTIAGTNMKRWDGSGHPRNTVELREQTCQERINDNYDVEVVEAGRFHEGDVLP